MSFRRTKVLRKSIADIGANSTMSEPPNLSRRTEIITRPSRAVSSAAGRSVSLASRPRSSASTAASSGFQTQDREIGFARPTTEHCLKRLPVVLILVMGLFGIAAAANANQPTDLSTSMVPPNWRLLPSDELTHERRFVSHSGDAWLSSMLDRHLRESKTIWQQLDEGNTTTSAPVVRG